MNKIYISLDIDEVFIYITFLDHCFGLLPYYPLFHSHLKVLRINDKDYSITFATYFNVEWYERRLKVVKELEVKIFSTHLTKPNCPPNQTKQNHPPNQTTYLHHTKVAEVMSSYDQLAQGL